MHAFFLRILSYHCQDIWGMDPKIADGDGRTTDPITSDIRLTPKFQSAFLALRTETLETLSSFSAHVLHYLAVDQGIRTKGRRKEHIMAILTQYVMPISCHSVTQWTDSALYSDVKRDGLTKTRNLSEP